MTVEKTKKLEFKPKDKKLQEGDLLAINGVKYTVKRLLNRGRVMLKQTLS